MLGHLWWCCWSCVCGLLYEKKKNQWRKVVLWEGPGCLEYIEYWMFSNCISFNGSRTVVVVVDPIEMNPLISKNKGCWTVIDVFSNFVINCRKCRIWPGFLYTYHWGGQSVHLPVQNVTGIISSVKAECVIPMSCVGTRCPLKQSQAVAYFHTEIIQSKYNWQFPVLTPSVLISKVNGNCSIWEDLLLSHTNFMQNYIFPYIFEELKCTKLSKQINFFAEISSMDPTTRWSTELKY